MPEETLYEPYVGAARWVTLGEPPVFGGKQTRAACPRRHRLRPDPSSNFRSRWGSNIFSLQFTRMNSRIAYGAAFTIALLVIGAGVGPGRAQLPPDTNPVIVGHEVSGEKFAYQVQERDTTDSIASRFGEPALTLSPDESEPKPATRSPSITAT
jgi:hypothetical protein